MSMTFRTIYDFFRHCLDFIAGYVLVDFIASYLSTIFAIGATTQKLAAPIANIVD